MEKGKFFHFFIFSFLFLLPFTGLFCIYHRSKEFKVRDIRGVYSTNITLTSNNSTTDSSEITDNTSTIDKTNNSTIDSSDITSNTTTIYKTNNSTIDSSEITANTTTIYKTNNSTIDSSDITFNTTIDDKTNNSSNDKINTSGDTITKTFSYPHDSIDRSYCGHWQEQYTLFHKEMEKSNNKKYLILDAHQAGWGDRLTQIISGFYVALLSKRSFKIVGVDLEKNLEKPNIDWSISEEEISRLEKNNLIKDLQYKEFNNNLVYNEGFLYTNFTSNFEKYEAIRYRIQNGKLRRIINNVFHRQQLYEMGIRPDTAFGCAFEYLFKPKQRVMDLVKETYEALEINRDYYMGYHPIPSYNSTDYLPSDKDEPLRIGIQIRTGDSTFRNDTKSICNKEILSIKGIENYFSCAQDIENEFLKYPYQKSYNRKSEQSVKKERKVYWYLMTDCKLLRIIAKEKWPNKVVTITDKTIQHFEKAKTEESLDLTFAEHWLFGEMDFHVITKDSFFGRTAALRRKLYHNIYDIDLHSTLTRKCTLYDFNTFEDTSKNWFEIR